VVEAAKKPRGHHIDKLKPTSIESRPIPLKLNELIWLCIVSILCILSSNAWLTYWLTCLCTANKTYHLDGLAIHQLMLLLWDKNDLYSMVDNTTGWSPWSGVQGPREFSQLVIVHCSSCDSCDIGRRICTHGARGRTVPEGECVHVRQCTTEIFISQTQQLDLKFYPMMDWIHYRFIKLQGTTQEITWKAFSA